MSDGRQKRRFEALIVPHLGDALSLARWLTGNAADAEDVVQDACIRAFNAIATCDDQKARSWLLAIVRNCAFTWMARNRLKQMTVTDDDDDDAIYARASATLLATSATPEAHVIAQADSDQLHRAIARLPRAFREILVLRELNECSYREIAEIAAIPVGTVMSRLARARALLIADIGRHRDQAGPLR